MAFAKYVFIAAGLWGVAVLTPLFFLVDIAGRPYTAPTDYPHFFYGFLVVALAWQIAFLIIGSNPVRFRPLMITGFIEKAGYVIGATVLHAQGRISAADASTAVPDALLLALFVMAFVKTRPSACRVPASTWSTPRSCHACGDESACDRHRSPLRR